LIVYPNVKRDSNIFWSVFDIQSIEDQIQKLDKVAEDPGLWNEPKKAQLLMKKLSDLRNENEVWDILRRRLQDTLELAQFGDSTLLPELEKETIEIETELDNHEFQAMFLGKWDRGGALLAIHAGAGGTDSQDWAEMLQRMYLRWIELKDFESETLDLTEGEEAGIKSTTIAVDGPYAYGYLKSEKGVHRLVRLSPFDSAHRRHTSFALVEVLPQVEDDEEIEINPDDLSIDVFRSSGAGGQNVQKNATAIRMTHIPTGIVVTCQNERSQLQNRENALRVLKSRLLELKQQEQVERLSELRGEYKKAEWGNQIRSYVLHPYQMVKDHRTNYEEGNTQAVLNGEIEGFVEAYLRYQMGVADSKQNT
jgi:peptide chain release factor 2